MFHLLYGLTRTGTRRGCEARHESRAQAQPAAARGGNAAQRRQGRSKPSRSSARPKAWVSGRPGSGSMRTSRRNRCCACRSRRSSARRAASFSSGSWSWIIAITAGDHLLVLLHGRWSDAADRHVRFAVRAPRRDLDEVVRLPFEHGNWSVGKDFDRIRKYNPLGRVPTLVTDKGEIPHGVGRHPRLPRRTRRAGARAAAARGPGSAPGAESHGDGHGRRRKRRAADLRACLPPGDEAPSALGRSLPPADEFVARRHRSSTSASAACRSGWWASA